MAEIGVARDIEEIGVRLIDEYHEHIRENGVRILYRKSDQDKAQRGRSIGAEIVPLGGTAAWLSGFIDVVGDAPNEGYDFMLTAYGSLWEGYTAKQREAAIDAELCKLVEKTVQHRDGETTVIKLQDYDVKGFTANIGRFGLWASRLRIFAAKAKQLPLELNEAEARGEEAGIGEGAEVENQGDEEPASEPERKLAAVK